jgi:hypothetical protein
MRWGLALFGMLAACNFEPPSTEGADGGPGGDGTGCRSFSSQIDTCKLDQQSLLNLSGELLFNTDTNEITRNGTAFAVISTLAQTADGEMRVLLAAQVIFQVNAHLRVEGARGFGIVATDTITMATGALIDVSAGGAGHRTTCPGGPLRGMDDNDGAAGGGGGGFGALGGPGGNGDADNVQSLAGAGGSFAFPAPTGVLGGCDGASGGDQSPANLGGLAGLGGGAVYLASRKSIGIAMGAVINASGGGGGGGTRTVDTGDAGGGGGGSGGMIFLEAPVIRSDGILAANGGGGGEGSGGSFAGVAGPAGMLGIGAAPGGMGGTPTGADGGSGGHRASPLGARPTMVLNGGGGGGGGGVGIIRVASPDQRLGDLVSPAPTM